MSRSPFRSFAQFSLNARLFLLATIISGITTSGMQLFFNLYLRSRGYDMGWIGLLNALPSGAALVLGLPLGFVSDRLGRRRSMLGGLLVSGLAAGALVNAPTPELMALAAGAMGAGNMLLIVSQAPFMMNAARPHERALLFSLNWGLTTISGAVGNLLAGPLPAWVALGVGVSADSPVAYQAVLTGSVGCGLFALAPLWLIREGRLSDTLAPAGFHWGQVRRLFAPRVLRLIAPNFLIGFGAAILIPYMNIFFKTRFTLSDAELGVLFGLSAGIMGVASVLGPALAVRLGSKIRAIVWTQSLSLLFLLALGFAPNFGLAALGFLARAALMNMAMPLYTTFAMEQTPETERSSVNSMLQLMWNVGWAVGPYLSGVVQKSYGFGPLFIATGLLYSLAVWLTWRFFSQAESVSPSPLGLKP